MFLAALFLLLVFEDALPLPKNKEEALGHFDFFVALVTPGSQVINGEIWSRGVDRDSYF